MENYARATRRYRLSLASFYLVAVVAVGGLTVYTSLGQELDSLAMHAVAHHFHWPQVYEVIAHSVASTWVLGLFVVVLLVSVLWRQRYQLLARAAIVLVGANATAQALKAVLPRPFFTVDYAMPNSFPSGNVTLAASVAVVLIGVVPPAFRRWATFVSWFLVMAVGISVVALGWHRPADVLGAMMLAGIFGLLALPAERPERDCWAPRGFPAGLAVAVFLVSGLALGAVGYVYVQQLTDQLELSLLAEATVPGLPVAVLTLAAIAGISASVTFAIDFLAGTTRRY